MGWNNTMKTILLIIGFCIEVACYTAILSFYDWKAFLLTIGASLGACVVAIMQTKLQK